MKSAKINIAASSDHFYSEISQLCSFSFYSYGIQTILVIHLSLIYILKIW